MDYIVFLFKSEDVFLAFLFQQESSCKKSISNWVLKLSLNYQSLKNPKLAENFENYETEEEISVSGGL